MQKTIVLLLALAALAGCAGKQGDDAPEDIVEQPPAIEQAPAPQVPGNSSVDETIKVVNETRTNFVMTGCLNPRMLFGLEPEYAQSLVPPPFEAADVTGLVQFTGAP